MSHAILHLCRARAIHPCVQTWRSIHGHCPSRQAVSFMALIMRTSFHNEATIHGKILRKEIRAVPLAKRLCCDNTPVPQSCFGQYIQWRNPMVSGKAAISQVASQFHQKLFGQTRRSETEGFPAPDFINHFATFAGSNGRLRFGRGTAAEIIDRLNSIKPASIHSSTKPLKCDALIPFMAANCIPRR